MQICYAMLPLSAHLKDFWFRRLASWQDQKFISKLQQSINRLCMVDHAKFLMHLRLHGMLQHNHWGLTDGSPLQNIGARAPGIDVHCMSQRSTDTSDRIHYQWTSAVAGIVFQSLTVAAIRGPCLKLLLWIFAWQNLDRTPATSQRKWHAENFGRMSFGGPFPAGGSTHVRTVPNG